MTIFSEQCSSFCSDTEQCSITENGQCDARKPYTILNGNCLTLLKELPDCSVDAVVTDPPYGLGRQPNPAEVMKMWIEQKAYHASGKGFLNCEWDNFVPSPIVWEEIIRVLKHGGHVLCFAGTRTQDWMTMSLRFAGFEIRDCIMWLYASGFPKSLDAGKAVERMTGEKQDHWNGWKSCLKPAYEPIIVARKPLDGTIAENIIKHGVGALNIDGCRVGDEEIRTLGYACANNDNSLFNRLHKDKLDYQGNTHYGRYPANILHDGSDEVIQAFPTTKPSRANKQSDNRSTNFYRCGGLIREGVAGRRDPFNSYNDDGGSAARFFYSAKASKEDRDEGLEDLEPLQYSHDGRETEIENPYQRNKSIARNNHPTVKPTKLMRYLCRLITPRHGIILDPFCGSGSTGKAAILEGFRFIGIEIDPHFAKIAEKRCEFSSSVSKMNKKKFEQLNMFE